MFVKKSSRYTPQQKKLLNEKSLKLKEQMQKSFWKLISHTASTKKNVFYVSSNLTVHEQLVLSYIRFRFESGVKLDGIPRQITRTVTSYKHQYQSRLHKVCFFFSQSISTHRSKKDLSKFII